MVEMFIRLLNMSITAGWLIIAVIIFRFLLKKAHKSFICFMWFLVGLRLMLPVSFESPLSLVPDRAVFVEDAADNGVFNMNVTADDVGSGAVDEHAGSYYQLASKIAANEFELTLTLTAVATATWFTGMTVMLTYALISYIRLKLKLSTATILRDNIRRSEAATSPFVLGIIKPVIYVPYDINEGDMDYIIAHETSHIKRGDHITKIAGFLLLSVYWFNPLVWLSYIMLCKDIELACDEKTVKSLDEASRKAYSTALLNCAAAAAAGGHTHIIAACPVAFGEVNVKERVKSIMNYKKSGFYIAIASVLVLAVVAVCFMTDPVKNNNENNTGESINNETISEEYVYNQSYTLVVEDKSKLNPVVDAIGLPHVSLDTANKKFHFFYDAFSSYMIYGSYTIEDGILIGITRDGTRTYRFKIDGDKIIFIKEGSATVRVTDSENIGYTIEDGSVFELNRLKIN